MEAQSRNRWVTRKVLFPRLLIPRCIPLSHPELDWNWSPRGACLHIADWTSLATYLTSPQAHIPVNPKLYVQNGTHYLSSGLPRWCVGKESTCQCRRCRRLGFDPWVRNIPWRRRILAWRIAWTEEPGELQAMGSQRVSHHWALTHWPFLQNRLPPLTCWGWRRRWPGSLSLWFQIRVGREASLGAPPLSTIMAQRGDLTCRGAWQLPLCLVLSALMNPQQLLPLEPRRQTLPADSSTSIPVPQLGLLGFSGLLGTPLSLPCPGGLRARVLPQT